LIVSKGEPTPSNSKVAVSDLVTLPQSFGSIFLGETFTSYVIAHNESGEKVTNVVVKAELQMKAADKSRTMVLLSDADKPATAELEPGASVDDIVSHEVKQLGVHILVCSVWYNVTGDERKFFRKFFRFEVEKPLDIKTKVYVGCVVVAGSFFECARYDFEEHASTSPTYTCRRVPNLYWLLIISTYFLVCRHSQHTHTHPGTMMRMKSISKLKYKT
jgi:hypothetical protein